MDTPSIADLLSVIGAGGAGVVGYALWLRRKVSRDNVQISHDSKQRDWMSDVMHKNELAEREAAKLREQLVTAMKDTATAETRMRLIQGDYEHLARMYERLRQRTQRMAQKMAQHGLMDPSDARDFDTQFSGLEDLKTPKRHFDQGG